MKTGKLFITLGVLISTLVVGVLALSFSNAAAAATGCTCPTGCATRTVQNAPYTLSGAGEYCVESTNLGAYVQSWGADQINISGLDYTNLYVTTDSILRDTTGKFFVYYKSVGGNGNFSTNGTSDITNCTKAWCSSAQYGQMNFAPFTMYNNVWGASTGTGQTIQANSPSDWNVVATFPETGGVKTYPNASLDLNGKTISTLGSCTSSFNVTVPATGSWETAYDLWVPSEIMIWMNQNGLVGPIASSWNDDGTPVVSAANITVGGHTWDVYHGGSNVVSFVRKGGNVNIGTVDILALLNWTADQGWISRTSNLGKFQFGFEITSAPGGLTFTTNSYAINCGGLGGVVPTATTGPSQTPSRTFTPAAATNTPTLGLTATQTRTNTPAATFTRTNTPSGVTATLTRTPTQIVGASPTTGPTATRTFTPTPGSGSACSPVSSTITAPFTYDGAGTFCWQSASLGTYLNSWNTTSVTINSVNITNLYMASGSYPAKIGGYWYVSYSGPYAWSHFEAK